MKIEFKPETKSIIIDDTASQQKQLVNILLVSNLLVGILHFIEGNFANLTVIDIFFLVLIIFTIGGLIYLNFFNSYIKQYSLDEIIEIKSYTSFNRINYELVLRNGKNRILYFGDNFASIEQLKLLLNEK